MRHGLILCALLVSVGIAANPVDYDYASKYWYTQNVSTNLPADFDTVVLISSDGVSTWGFDWKIAPYPSQGDLDTICATTNVVLWYRAIELDKASDVTDWDAQVKALALVYLDEINILRAEHGLAPRTKKQLRAALKKKLEQ